LIRLIVSQRELGKLSPAIAQAEDIFRTQPSRQNFLIFSDLYFQKGDFGALALLARKYEQFDDLKACVATGLRSAPSTSGAITTASICLCSQRCSTSEYFADDVAGSN
jgi:hypothetical protein